MNKQPPDFLTTSEHAEDLAWSDRLRVGHPKIDHMHIEFVELANALLHCTETSAIECLGEIEVHILEHFDNEKMLMEKADYPATDCHLDEHNKVLETVSRVRLLHSQGNVTLNDIHRLAKALIDWFPGHIFYMDSALSTWLSKNEYQGSPLVFHRNTPKSEPSREREPTHQAVDYGEC